MDINSGGPRRLLTALVNCYGAFLTTISPQMIKLQLQISLEPCRLTSSLLLGLLHDEGFVDVGDDTTAGNGCLDQRVELFISSNRE